MGCRRVSRRGLWCGSWNEGAGASRDEAAARAVLEGEPASAAVLPADLAEPPCPQRGSRDVSQTSEPIEDPDTARARGGRRGRQWYCGCGGCGHRWLNDDE
jgi:hypothetical protein